MVSRSDANRDRMYTLMIVNKSEPLSGVRLSQVSLKRSDGTPVDLLGMFLWGFGLTTFGAGIQQLTPRQVATQIGVVVPKSGAADASRT